MNEQAPGARIIRGFSRVGIGAAVLVAICGVGITGIMATDQYLRLPSAPRLDAGYKAFKSGPSGGRVPANIFDQFDNPPPPGFVIDQPGMFDDLIPSPASVAAKTAGIGFGITGLLGLAAFGFFRGLGWIIAGFARD